jgi:hypothetical protein
MTDTYQNKTKQKKNKTKKHQAIGYVRLRTKVSKNHKLSRFPTRQRHKPAGCGPRASAAGACFPEGAGALSPQHT